MEGLTIKRKSKGYLGILNFCLIRFNYKIVIIVVDLLQVTVL